MLTKAINEVSRALAFLIVEKGEQTSFGTGYVVSRTGHLLTCHHLVQGASQIKAHLTSGTGTAELEVVDADEQADLALLKVAGGSPPEETVAIHTGAFVTLGTEVAFLGFSYSDLFQPPLVMTMRGIVGNRYAIQDTDYYVIDAMASSGFSGGPLFLSRNGAVCGTVSARFDPLQTRLRREGQDPGGATPQRTNLTFAVTSAPALELLRRVRVPFKSR